jgi:dolichol-phosphate mannosyltransferase
VTDPAKPLISVASPVYCCAKCLDDLCRRLKLALEGITPNYEIILVNDSSPDDSWDVIRGLCAADARIKGIALSRNFGQHAAIAAALERASGDWVVVMDCDLQDRPEEIARLYAKAREGYGAVFAERTDRKDKWFKRMASRAFAAVLNYLSGANYDARTANFGIFSRAVIDAVRSLGGSARIFPMAVRWTGFDLTSIPVQHDARGDGDSAYTWKKLLRLALDIILASSDKPLRLVAAMGIAVSVVAIAVTVYSVLLYVRGNVSVAGYTSLIASMWLLAGITLFCMGIVGLYVGRIFENVKSRPAFIVRDRLNP